MKVKRDIKYTPNLTKPYGLCSNCYKRKKCNVVTQSGAKILFCVYQ